MRKIIIIGNGVAGVTAAREIRKRDSAASILIISGESKHHFSRTALMYIFMGHLTYDNTKPYADDFWQKNRIGLQKAWVKSIQPEQKSITLADGDSLHYDELIIATGSSPNLFGWPGQDLPGVQSLYSKQDVELLEENVKTTKQAVIVGGGLIGVEMAEMLVSRGIKVTFLVREKNFWDIVLPREEAQMINRHIREHHIDLRLETELDRIEPDSNGRVTKVFTKNGEEIPCQLVALTVGVHPNISWLTETEGLETNRGVLVDHHFATSAPHIWSVGDCAEFRAPLPGRRPIEQVWYTGKMQSAHLASTLCGEVVSYEPGIWWNSAKFLDIEYQTYGMVMPALAEGEATFYWEAPCGKKSLRINYRTDSLAVTGCNVFGIRHRHQVWEKWIQESTAVTEVLAHLKSANFDPEFFTQHEEAILQHWNAQHSQHPVSIKSKKGLLASIFG